MHNLQVPYHSCLPVSRNLMQTFLESSAKHFMRWMSRDCSKEYEFEDRISRLLKILRKLVEQICEVIKQ